MADAILLHRRLSILDLSEAGWQPMGTPDGRYYIVFNGEIYNYLELRAELQKAGHQFRSSSDTEVLLAGYVQWGKKVLNRLLGMFAFAILDVREQTVFLSRDAFGIKPLYYTQWGDGFAFASEIRPLLDLPGVSRSVNPQRLYEYLHSGITDHGGETLFADIKQLPAAHYMQVSLDDRQTAQPVRYWQLDLNRKAELSLDEAAARLRDLFVQNIRLHLRSHVPVGVALSGGIDSSSIVMAMRHLDRNLEIHTFTYVADDPALSEECWVDIAGKSAHAVVHKVSPKSEDLKADLCELINVQGEAFISTSIYAQRRVFQKVRQAGIKVMLDGQGADELLGGYGHFLVSRLGSLLRQGRWHQAAQLSRSMATAAGRAPVWLQPGLIKYLVPSAPYHSVRSLVRKDKALIPAWLNSTWFIERGVNPESLRFENGREVLKEDLHRAFSETSLPQLLRFEDRNSMASSVESRVPFLTVPLAEFLFSLPEDYVVNSNGMTKAVFRKAMRGIVPDSILDRRDKIGFTTPEGKWLSALRPWVQQTLNSETAAQLRVINHTALQQVWDKMVRAQSQVDSRVWRWVNLIKWAETFEVDMN
jgi:asparagine synthase (glutamine-hydrolysing)